jgi:hypothetical protein
MSTTVANGNKRLKVTLNYNGNEEKLFNIPESMNEKQIQAWITKKFGIYDVKNWVVTNPET